ELAWGRALRSSIHRCDVRRRPRSDGDTRACSRAGARGASGHGLARDDLAELVLSINGTAADHAVRHALRDPRCARPALSRTEDGAEPGAVVGGERGWPNLPVQIAAGVEVS